MLFIAPCSSFCPSGSMILNSAAPWIDLGSRYVCLLTLWFWSWCVVRSHGTPSPPYANTLYLSKRRRSLRRIAEILSPTAGPGEHVTIYNHLKPVCFVLFLCRICGGSRACIDACASMKLNFDVSLTGLVLLVDWNLWRGCDCMREKFTR